MTRKHQVMRFTDFLMVPAYLLAILWAVGTYLIDVDYWLDVERVYVGDAIAGQAAPFIDVERTIKRTFSGRYTVDVRSWPKEASVCSNASGALNYRPSAQLPADIDLAWWIGGKRDYRDCSGGALSAGQYFVQTCHTVLSPFGILSDKTSCIDSNVFEIIASDSEEEFNAAQRQVIDEIQETLQTLTKEASE